MNIKIKKVVASTMYKPTEIEQLIISYLSDGMTRKEIVDILGISNTVLDYYLRTLYSKILVKNAAHCIAWAFRTGHLK